MELTNQLRRAEAYAATLNEQLATYHAEFLGESQEPAWPQHEAAPSEVPSDRVRSRIAASLPKATIPRVFVPAATAPPPGLTAAPASAQFEDFADKLIERLNTVKARRSSPSRRADGSDDEPRPRFKEAESIKVPTWPRVENFSVWINQLTRNVNAAAARPDDKAIAWLNRARDKSHSFDDLAICEDRFQVLDRKLAKSLMEILPTALLHKITLKETTCLNKGYQLRGRQILMLICAEFKVNADLGFTYSIQDLSILEYPGDKNLQQFVNKWDTILAELEVDKIGANALARMFENKLTTSKLLESEVRHFRHLSDGHADKN